jgi:hypothetical protein
MNMNFQQRSLHFVAACLLSLSLLPVAASADAASGHANDDINVRMRTAAASATSESKEQQLNKMLAPNLPKVPLHSEFVVETNSKGQVTRVRSGKNSKDRTFDLMTYGNVLQTYIRTDTGHADAGTFRVIYDYSPVSHHVKRDVNVISLGGVNPNAEGAVYEMRREQQAAHEKSLHAAAPHK